jgi:N-acetylneuraminic acid mutarotase
MLYALADGAQAELAVKIDFAPVRAAVPAGYLPDVGDAFGDRGNGLSYGWDADNRPSARDRNAANSPDQRYDTFTHTQRYGVRTWELAVANGDYSVRVVAGDPTAFNSAYGFNAEGQSVVAGRPSPASPWFDGTRTVTVADGRLTISNAAGSSNNKIAFVEITSVHVDPGPDPEPVPTPAPAGWTTLAPSPVARFESASAAVGGKFYVFGGYDKNILAFTRSDVYDPTTDRWSPIAPMPQPITHAGVATDGPVVYFAGGFVGERSFVTTANVWRYDTRTNAWTALTPLPEPRAGGGLVRLGRELHYFAGTGVRQQRDYGDHWVLDLDAPPGAPAAAWRPLAPLPLPRNHVGYAAAAGKIYCVGGLLLGDERLGNVDNVDAYDPATDRWTPVARLPEPLSHVHTSTVVVGNRIITVGGTTDWPYYPKTVADVFSYDPAANAWTALPPLPDVRQAAAAQVIGDKLYVTSGTPTGIHPQPTTWARPVVNAWDAGPSAPAALGDVAGGVIGTTAYFVGAGSTATLAYNISTGKWSAAAALATRLFYGGASHAAEVVGGKLYLFGGLSGGAEGQVQVYDPAKNAWSLGPPMPFAAGACASAVIGGKVYVAGGVVGSATTARTACFDPKTNTWTELAPMPRPRNGAAAGTDGKRLFLFGGRGPGSGDDGSTADGFDTVQVYNPATNQWFSSAVGGSALKPMPQGRAGAGRAVFYKGEFYILGGETLTGSGKNGATADGVYRRVDVYNPSQNAWRLAPSLPTARQGIYPLLLSNRVYVAGGGARAGASTSATLEILDLP